MTASYNHVREEDLSHEFSFSPQTSWDPQGIAMWSENAYQNFGAQFGQSAGFNSQVSDSTFGGYDVYDQSTYMQSAAGADYNMPTAHRPNLEILPHHMPNSVRARRTSIHSTVASSVQRPESAYADSSYFASSSVVSPILSTTDQTFYGQDLYSPNASDIFELTGVEHSIATGSPLGGSDEDSTSSSESAALAYDSGEAPPRSHPLYQVSPNNDGYYHCPFASTENCGHEPKMLKCEYDKHIDSHLKPFKCRNSKCRDLQFSSTACLLRHEREAHEMHGHAESLCEYPPCNRSMPGNGFRRSYNCKDHMTRCHGWIESSPTDNKKRRSISNGKLNGVGKAAKTKVPSKKQQAAKLRQEWHDRKMGLEELMQGLTAEGPLTDMRLAQIHAECQLLGTINETLQKLERRGGTSG